MYTAEAWSVDHGSRSELSLGLFDSGPTQSKYDSIREILEEALQKRRDGKALEHSSCLLGVW